MNSNINQGQISADDLNRLLTDRSETILIDLLSPDHFADRHIPDAKNACVFQVSFLDDIRAIAPDKKTPIIIYGAGPNSRDAETAIEKLNRAGYGSISFLKGGLDAWRKAGHPLEGNAPQHQDDPQTNLTMADGEYRIDSDTSRIEWTGRNPTTSHFGTVDIAKGSIDIKNGKITGRVEIDMTTIHNINLAGNELQPVLEAHLRSDDFFFTQMFPKATFTVTEAKRIEPGWLTAPNCRIKGELNLRGVSAELEFDATAATVDDGSLVIEAHFDMDRTRWNIIYGSTRFFEHLGMHKVFDLISIQLRVFAGK